MRLTFMRRCLASCLLVLIGPILAFGSGQTEPAPAGQQAVPVVPSVDELADMSVPAALEVLGEADVPTRIRVASELSERAIERRDTGRAVAWAEVAADEAVEADLFQDAGRALRRLALLQDATGELRAGIRSAARAARAFAEAGDVEAELEAMSVQANIEHRLGVLVDGIETASRIIARFEEYPVSEQFMADVLSNAAMMHFKIGRLEAVPSLLEQASSLYETIGDDDGLGTVYRIWGNYMGARSEPQQAILYYERAADRYRQTGNVFDAANVYFNTALMLMQVEEFEASVLAFEEAITGFSQAGSASGTGMAATELTVALWELERYEEAERTIQQAIVMLEASQSLRRLARAYSILGTMFGARGSDAQALAQLERARDLYDELGLATDALRIQQEMRRLQPERRNGGI